MSHIRFRYTLLTDCLFVYALHVTEKLSLLFFACFAVCFLTNIFENHDHAEERWFCLFWLNFNKIWLPKLHLHTLLPFKETVTINFFSWKTGKNTVSDKESAVKHPACAIKHFSQVPKIHIHSSGTLAFQTKSLQLKICSGF